MEIVADAVLKVDHLDLGHTCILPSLGEPAFLDVTLTTLDRIRERRLPDLTPGQPWRL